MEKEIKLERRIEQANNSMSAVDDSITKITLWKLNKTKYYFLIFLYLISLGTLYIIQRLFNKVFILIACDYPFNQEDFDYVLIQTDSKEEYVVKVFKAQFNTNISHHPSHQSNKNLTESDKLAIDQSIYIDNNIKHNKYNYVFFFRENKYIYIEEQETFIPVHFKLTQYTNAAILGLFKSRSPGISTSVEYNYLLSLYGPNKIYLESKTAFFIFLSFMVDPLYVYNIYAIINWIITEYYIGAVLLAILTLAIQGIRTCLEHRTYDNLNDKSIDCFVRRPFASEENISIAAEQLVPGDIVFAIERSILPFDGLILEGIATVSESDLTGESSLVMKVALESTAAEPFSFEGNEKSILFQGSEIIQCQSNHRLSPKNGVMVLVINTGFNTSRGKLIQNFQSKQTSNFSLLPDFIKLGIVSLVLWVCSIIVLFFFDFVNRSTVKFLFDNLTILLPPCISVSMGFCSFFFHYALMKKGISCIESSKLLVAGAVNTIIFDKTGTLTRHDIEMKGCMITSEEKDQLILIREDRISTLNKVHKLFWRTKCQMARRHRMIDQDYQCAFRNLPIFFTECLASCHCVDLFNEEPFGNSIDKMLYNSMRWHLYQEDQSLFILPPNPFKISSFKSFDEEEEKIAVDAPNQSSNGKSEYKLQYLHRSEFSSKSQSMCVIVRNMLDNSIRLYSKGAPEKMLPLCIRNTIPINFDEEYIKLTKGGMRVLSCCTRLISEEEWRGKSTKAKKEVREKLEKDLVFLGLVIFSNKLKDDTKKVIENLTKAHCKILISTGDNPYSTISVAKECEVIKDNNEVFILDYEENKFKLNRIAFEKQLTTNSILSSFEEELDQINKKSTNLQPIMPQNDKDGQYEQLFNDGFLSTFNQLRHDDKIKICFSGNSLSKLIELASQHSLAISSIFRSFPKKYDTVSGLVSCLIHEIKRKGVIFSRMLPYHKAQLVNLLKMDRESIISMCGDGANDCNAIMASDVGIAIRQPKNQCLSSHFFSSIDSIVCVEKIIQNGRACYENHIVLFKSMVLGGVIQLTGTIILLIRNYYFAAVQFAFLDFICSVIPVFLATNTCSSELGTNKPYQSIISKSFVINVAGQTILQVGLQLGFQIWFAGIVIDPSLDIPRTTDDLLLVYPSYMFICCVFQYLGTIIVFNSHDTNRKKTYKNKLFTYYITGVIFFIIVLITIKDCKKIFFGKELIIFEEDNNRFEYRREMNTFLALVYGISNLLVYYFYDMLITFIIPNEV